MVVVVVVDVRTKIRPKKFRRLVSEMCVSIKVCFTFELITSLLINTAFQVDGL